MDPYLGTFAVGDNVHTARIACFTHDGTPWGTGMGTGWTTELEVHKAGVAAVLVTLTGSWETADEFAALFTIGDVALLAPTSPATSASYEAYIKNTKVSSVFISGPDGDVRTPYKFTVREVSP